MQKNKTFFLRFLRLLLLLSLNVLLIVNHANAQTITVTGRITDQAGQPLPGVNITVKGSLTGTTTVADGRYTIKGIPPNAVLSFSFIGFKNPRKYPLMAKNKIDVQLQEDVMALSEVTVNAGYYAVKERERTGSIGQNNCQRN